MGILTDAGRAAMAKAIKEQSIFLALGTGGPDWDDTPPVEQTDATGLTAEIGRKALARSLFVLPSEDGELDVPVHVTTDDEGNEIVDVQRYSVSVEPTRHLYLEFRLDFADALNATIRELGIVIGATLKGGVPAGKTYFVADEFTTPGLLFQIEHREPLIRKANVRETFTWVISI